MMTCSSVFCCTCRMRRHPIHPSGWALPLELLLQLVGQQECFGTGLQHIGECVSQCSRPCWHLKNVWSFEPTLMRPILSHSGTESKEWIPCSLEGHSQLRDSTQLLPVAHTSAWLHEGARRSKALLR